MGRKRVGRSKKIIQGYLGSDFVVESSIGHIRDLPKKGGMSIDIENGDTTGSQEGQQLLGQLSYRQSSSEVGSTIERLGEEVIMCKKTTSKPAFRRLAQKKKS